MSWSMPIGLPGIEHPRSFWVFLPKISQYSVTCSSFTSATIESCTNIKILASSFLALISAAVSIAANKFTSDAIDWISELIPLRTSWAAIPLSEENTLISLRLRPKKL